jgi:carbon starvation protein
MHRAKYAWITLLPMCWLITVTFTAAWEKMFSPSPRIGFLAAASKATNPAIIFNNQLDAALCGLFLILVTTILLDSGRQWIGILRGSRAPESTETAFIASALQAEEI